MSLGFLQHKDSVVDLASLLEAHHKDCPIDFADPKYSVGLEKVGDCAEVIFDSHTIADDAAAAFKADRLAEAGAEEENEFLEQDAHTDVLATAKVTSSVLNANRSTRTANVPASTTDDHFDWTTGQNYGYDADKNDVSLEEHGGNQVNLLTCLFPWLFDPPASVTETEAAWRESKPYPRDPQRHVQANEEVSSSTNPEIEISSSPKESEPVAASQQDSTAPETQSAIRGILKRAKLKQDDVASPAVKGGKRSLFSTRYSNQYASKNEDKRKLEFSPMARVVTIESSQNMELSDKAEIWWQPAEYADFKKTARLIAKAMLQGGSEVWLMTNPSWKKNGHRQEERKEETTSDKWWCKFGHSRRGLEHISSPEEGSERQRNVLQSRLVVVKEQRRQQRSNLMNANRIRQVYIRHNHWSRELALAAGASDAEAVRSNFHDDSRSRAFYLVEHQSQENPASNHIPEFMNRLRLQETKEKLHEAPLLSGNTCSLSKKAVGFGTRGNVNMAAVLSGRGA